METLDWKEELIREINEPEKSASGLVVNNSLKLII